MILDGHIREIFGLDWGLNGHRVLSGAGDGWVKCWDVRNVKQEGGVGAHKGNVADLKWYKGASHPQAVLAQTERQEVQPRTAGTFVATAGFDKNVNIFSADDWALAKSLTGHSGNVLGVDVTADGKWIASCGHDRTVKLWGMEGEGSFAD